MQDDPVIDEIRRVRHEISAAFDHDPYKLVEHYKRMHETHLDQLARLRRKKGKQEKSTIAPVR